MLHMRALTRALRASTPLRMAAVRSIAPARSHALPWCCHRTAALSTTATPPSASAAAAAATPAERPTTADEQTDAEAGLNQPAQSKHKAEQQQQDQNEAPEGEDGAKESKAPLGPANWASVAFLLVVGGAAVIYYRYQQDKLQNTIRIETIGTPLLGGPFNLVDDTGKRVSSDSLKGKYILLYFGFTHCPDICPTELKKMEEALTLFEKMHPSHPIVPVFVSIDPRRDTSARLNAYKKDYDPRMLWLTGSDAEVSAVAKAYRVYYSAPDVAEGSDEDYLVDHSIFFYLLDREGQFMEFFGKSKSAEEVAGKMAQLVAAENK